MSIYTDIGKHLSYKRKNIFQVFQSLRRQLFPGNLYVTRKAVCYAGTCMFPGKLYLTRKAVYYAESSMFPGKLYVTRKAICYAEVINSKPSCH